MSHQVVELLKTNLGRLSIHHLFEVSFYVTPESLNGVHLWAIGRCKHKLKSKLLAFLSYRPRRMSSCVIDDDIYSLRSSHLSLVNALASVVKERAHVLLVSGAVKLIAEPW